jgi:cytochrome c oxidase subunit 2
MWLAIALTLLIAGSVLFHLLSPWYFTPLASNWTSIDNAIDVTFWVTGAVFVAVNAFMVYAIVKYRHKPGSTAHYEPENARLEKQLTLWTSVGIAALLAPGLYAWSQFVTVPDQVSQVEVLGQQWQWTYRFPGKDGVLGTSDVQFINDTNAFGINPQDPYGQDDVLIADSTVHLPIGQPVKMLLRSTDVLHDFFVPQFRARMNLVPGLVTYFWFTPTKLGEFEAVCAQLCGVGHYAMRGKVIIDTQAAFDTWLSQQPTFAQPVARAEQQQQQASRVERTRTAQ